MILTDKYNHAVWKVVQKIKRQCNYSETEDISSIDINLLKESNDELTILEKLSDWNAIRILNKKLKSGTRVMVSIQIIQPQFSKICQNFNNHDSIYSENYRNKCFSKKYLSREVERFELILKEFFKAGLIKLDDYEAINSRILKIFLQQCLEAKEITTKNKLLLNNFAKQDFQKIIPKPFPITGKIEVSGLKESLKELKPKSPENTRLKFPYKIPAGTNWDNIIIKFLDDERVEIYVKKQKHITDYKDMGMARKSKIPTPNDQWLFLKVLAQFNGEITIRNPEAKDKYKKQKQTLSETLKCYFSLDYDPFYPYKSSREKEGNSYKIKILLIPCPKRKDNIKASENDDTDSLGIREYLNESSTQQRFF